MKEYFSIGELASIFNITVQLLRHYDEKGLLVPEYRDEESGHRKYRFDQMYRLATIRYLRKLGYSLEQVNDFITLDDYNDAITNMMAQSEKLKKDYYDLLLIDNIIQKKINFIQEESKHVVEDSIVYKDFPARAFVLIGDETSLFTNELFYFYPTIGFYTGDEKRFGAYIVDSPDVISALVAGSNRQKAMLPAGRYACYYHHGPYQKIYDSIEKLLELDGRGLKADQVTIVTLNIIDQFIEAHKEKFVTELQLFID